MRAWPDAGDHAVCITGLERSFDEISGNLRAALGALYGGLDQHVHFFGVRPQQDSWDIVHSRLPPLRAEVVQRQCVVGRPVAYFSAYSRTASAFWKTLQVWLLTLCDQRAGASQVATNGVAFLFAASSRGAAIR